MTRLTPLPAPVAGVVGWSGSGKTTALCEVLRHPLFRNWRLGVIKHCHHPLTDYAAADTEQFRRAGAAVVLPWYDPDLSTPDRANAALAAAREALSLEPLDGLLIEGFEQAGYPKIWLGATSDFPRDAVGPTVTLLNDPAHIAPWLQTLLWRDRPLRAGILVGGASARMGIPKADILIKSLSISDLLKQSVSDLAAFAVLIGGEQNGENRLPDAPNCRGPMAGLLAALRADQHCTWLLLPCDLPCWTSSAAAWLLSQRAPGAAVIAPVLDGHLLPFPAIYEPGLLDALDAAIAEGETSPSRWLRRRGDVREVEIPQEFERAFRSANTPAEWEALTGELPHRAEG